MFRCVSRFLLELGVFLALKALRHYFLAANCSQLTSSRACWRFTVFVLGMFEKTMVMVLVSTLGSWILSMILLVIFWYGLSLRLYWELRASSAVTF